MAKAGDMYHDSKGNCHILLNMELPQLNGFLMDVLTKGHPMYGKKLTFIHIDNLKNPRFTLVGRKARIK